MLSPTRSSTASIAQVSPAAGSYHDPYTATRSRITLTDSSGHERVCFSARRVTQNIMMREATAPMQHHMLSGRWTSSSTIQPMCFRTEAPRPRRTTLVSVAELSPLVVVIPTFLASPAVARALRPVAECPALEVVVVADVTEPIIRPPFVSQFPSLATALCGEPESVCGATEDKYVDHTDSHMPSSRSSVQTQELTSPMWKNPAHKLRPHVLRST